MQRRAEIKVNWRHEKINPNTMANSTPRMIEIIDDDIIAPRTDGSLKNMNKNCECLEAKETLIINIPDFGDVRNLRRFT